MDERFRVAHEGVRSDLERQYGSRMPDVCRAMAPLLETSRIAIYRQPAGVYAIQLRTQDLFDNLVALYEKLFEDEWDSFRYKLENMPTSASSSPPQLAARVYVSVWFLDLYVSNRSALGFLAGNGDVPVHQAYRQEMGQVASKYDAFMALLNKWIRPVRVLDVLNHKGLYLPVIAQEVNVLDPNPFGISNFFANITLFHQIIKSMEDTRHWRLTDLPVVDLGNSIGRHVWLFDWHNGSQLCLWFPSKLVSLPEVMVAYVVGTSCTENQGVQDEDSWQFFPGGVVPPNPNPADYERVTARTVVGMHEVRCLVIEPEYTLVAISIQERVKSPRFKIVDWVYYEPVFGIQLDFEGRVNALKTLLGH